MNNIKALKGTEKNGFWGALIKGSLFSLSISIIAICIFAFALRFLDINTDLIKPINQVIKIISILLGTFLALKKVNEMGLVTGFLIGTIYTIFSFVVFSLLNGGVTLSTTILNDIIFGGIAGAIAGVISVNFKKR